MLKTTRIEKTQIELLELLKQKEEAIRYNKLATLYPDEGKFSRDKYPKHVAFMNATEFATSICFMAGNRTGKTLTGAVLMAYHLTGRYPEWYTGRRFLNPISAWASGITAATTSKIQQSELLGSLMDIGTGTIPKDAILKTIARHGVSEAIATVYVRHVSGGVSELNFKSYDQGSDSFQGTKKHLVWLDEEPRDRKIYTECITRTAGAGGTDIPGIIMCTFTPLFGMTEIAQNFLENNVFPSIEKQQEERREKFVVSVGWDEVPHLSERDKKRLMEEYPDHEKDARSRGIPSLGSGAIYPFPESKIVCAPFGIPDWWPKAYGLDVGWKTTAAVWGTCDPASGVVYLYSEHYEGQSIPAGHASAIKTRGEWLWGTIDPASAASSQIDGRNLLDLYEAEGLNLQLADNSIEAGLLKCKQAFESGQLKIFSTCVRLIGEFRNYCRDENGKINKKNDHALDAMRYLIMGCPGIMREPPDEEGFEGYSYNEDRDSITGY